MIPLCFLPYQRVFDYYLLSAELHLCPPAFNSSSISMLRSSVTLSRLMLVINAEYAMDAESLRKSVAQPGK